MSESNGNMSQSRLHPDALVAAREQADSKGKPNRSRTSNLKSRRESIAKSKRIWLLVSLPLVLVAGLGFASLATTDSGVEIEEQSRVLAVRTVSVQPVTSFQAAREYTGAIVARRTSQLGFESAGKLQAIHFDEGDSILAGTALAKLDTEHLAARRRQLVARRAQAAAKLDEMIAGPRDERIAGARARVESLRAQVELLTLKTERRRSLVARNITTREDYEQYAFDLKTRSAQVKEAQHDLEELLNGTRKEQIEAQRAVVAELDAAIADVDVDLRKSILKAPFDGTIARRSADEGTVLQAGQPVFRLVEDQVLEAWIGLPAHATRQLSGGSLQRVKIDGRHFDATVASRFPEVDPTTRTRTVILKLDDSAAEHVIHGQVVRLELEETVQAGGFWLPSTALTMGTRGLWTVLVVEGEVSTGDSLQTGSLRVARRDVEVLHTESDRVLVRGTLNPGDEVIAAGTHRVVPGQLVRFAK